jgi:CRP-like cAMP-binding protein
MQLQQAPQNDKLATFTNNQSPLIMSDKSEIIAYIQKYVALTPEEASYFASCFTEVKIKKRQMMVQPGFTATRRNYVLNGALRSYVVNDAGQEVTIAFAVKDWWITDYNSYIYQQPATLFVVAVEDSTVLQLDFEKEQELKKSNCKFETFFRSIAERGLAFQQRTLITNLTHSAEERYDHFMEKYPQIAARVPQYALASYLGMTTEFLSKIRNNKVKRKS